MIIHRNQVKTDPLDIDVNLSSSDIGLSEDGVSVNDPVTIKAVAELKNDGIEINGDLNFTADINCIRCLKPVETEFKADFRALFLPAEHFDSSVESEVVAEDLDADVLNDESLDLNNVAREQILIALPDRVFCREDCKGICEKCGSDLNLIDCNCNENETDPRWSALKGLKG